MTKQFDQFTNQYNLTKTLRFELKPMFSTSNDSFSKIITKDKEIDILYHKEMKNMIDNLHEQFIGESLQDVSLPEDLICEIDNLFKTSKEIRKKKRENREKDYYKEELENNKKIDAVKEKLRKEIVNLFNAKAKDWKENKYSHHKINKNDIGILLEKSLLSILKEENPEKINIIKRFDDFSTYFTGFNQNKANYYLAENKDTAIANRIIDENLIRFLENKEKFNDILSKTSILDKYKEVFELNSYSHYLNQSGIDCFNEAVGEINSEMNLFCQQNKELFKRTPKLKLLFKQIGCKQDKKFILTINDGEEWRKLIELYDTQKELIKKVEHGYDIFFNDIERYDLDLIYFNKISINTISNRWFANWHKLAELLQDKKIIKKTETEKIPEKISLANIKDCLIDENNHEEIFKTGKISDEFKNGEYGQFFDSKKNCWEVFIDIWKMEIKKNIIDIESKFESFQEKKNSNFETIKQEEKTNFIKGFCDSILSIERMVKYHKVKEENEKDSEYYEWVDHYLNNTILNSYYNAFRNYLTQKPFKQDKIKLNFNSTKLAGGFDLNKEKENLTIILKKGDDYYLAIIDKKHNKSFERNYNKELYKKDDSVWKKLDYKLLVGASKSIPKQATQVKEAVKHFSSSNDDYILSSKSYAKPLKITRKIFDLNNITYEKSDITKIAKIKDDGVKKFQKEYLKLSNDYETYKDALTSWIDFCKEYLSSYGSCQYFDYSHLRPAESYESLNEFYKDVDMASYFTEFVNINEKELLSMCEKEEIYLFRIYNKDFAEKKKGKDNLETIILRNLFSSTNLKLNGGASIFFREKSIEAKQDKTRNKDEGFGIIKNKRYSEDKYFFHFSVTINFKCPSLSAEKFNVITNERLSRGNYNILGIDRGEKHLIYYSLIDQKGNIKKQGSFNVINNKDYNQELSKRADEMRVGRESWEEIGKIKDLKDGYISQVVYEISKLVIEEDAVVVLEDLNSQFKAKRTAKVEKSVYKKFELALARKFSNLVLKERQPSEVGGVLNSYQLTPHIPLNDIAKFEKKKQWGIMLYIRPNYTSATDPLTGWRKSIYISNSANYKEIQEVFNPNQKQYIQINFDKAHNCFKFSYNHWHLFAHKDLERFYWSKKEKNEEGKYGVSKRYLLHQCFEELFTDLDKEKPINEQIFSHWDDNDQRWKTLIFYWNLLNQIRNTDRSKEGDENDFIQSPTWSDEIKGYFDSRKKYDKTYPENGDANGAYNTAKKGLMALNRIQECPEKPELFIKDEDWDIFAQK